MNHSKLSKIVLAFVLTAGVVFLAHTQAKADETQDLKDKVKTLEQKVDQLETQLSKQTGATTAQPTVNRAMGMNAYDPLDPFVQMQMMERQMGQMMKDNMVDFNGSAGAPLVPREDIKQTPDAYIISMDIPGMQKDKINIEIKDDTLIISGVRDNEVKETGPNHFYRQERSFGNFLRTVPLPKDAKSDNIDAQYNNGVLIVRVLRNKSSSSTPTGQKVKIK